MEQYTSDKAIYTQTPAALKKPMYSVVITARQGQFRLNPVLSLRNNCPSSSQPPSHPHCCSAQHQPKQKPLFFVACHLHTDGLHIPLPAVPYSPAVPLKWKLGMRTSKRTHFSHAQLAEAVRDDPKPRSIKVLFSKVPKALHFDLQ